jgi:hypothetical protein
MSDFFFSDDGLTTQSQLSTTYTAALTAYVIEAADYLASTQADALGIEQALAIKALIESGTFTLSDLFTAAQSKTGTIEDVAGTPAPTLTVDGLVISLASILGDTDTFTWLTLTKKEGTIYHTREFYTNGEIPDYDTDWSVVDVNLAPEAVTFAETATEWNIKTGEPTDGAEWVSIDLLQGTTSDADGDAISVVAGSVSVNGTLVGDATGLYVVEGNTLKIDTNSEYFTLLFADQTTDLAVSYEITDSIEGHEVASSGTITVTGTADQFSMTGTSSVSVTSFASNFDGSFDVVIPTSQLVEGADAYTDFAGTAIVTVTGDITGSTETVAIYVNDELSFKLGYTLNPDGGPFGGKEPDQNGYLGTDSDSTSFDSEGNLVGISYDSNVSSANGGSAGVDALTSITAVLSEVTYWA